MLDLEAAVSAVCCDYMTDLAELNIVCTHEGLPKAAKIAQNAHAECIRLLTALRLGYIYPRECLELVLKTSQSAKRRCVRLLEKERPPHFPETP